ncbi:hypothetical protein HMPREF3111_24925 [Proteus sp. HMSC10D02]|nr:hypothetical protein HMPREF3111_24925 [Proteus sp. HMSC10D02]
MAVMAMIYSMVALETMLYTENWEMMCSMVMMEMICLLIIMVLICWMVVRVMIGSVPPQLIEGFQAEISF